MYQGYKQLPAHSTNRTSNGTSNGAHYDANGKFSIDSNPESEPAQKSYAEYLEEIDLQRYLLVLKRRWWVVVGMALLFVIPAGLLAWWMKGLPQNYVATGKLLFQKRNPKSELTGLGQEVGKLDSVGGDPLRNELLILQSTELLKETAQVLDPTGRSFSAEALKRGLKINRPEKTDIFIVAYEAPNPQLAVDVVDKLMELYIIRNEDLTVSDVSAARDFIREQLPQLEADVDRATEDLRQFKLQHQIISLEQETGVVAERITQIDQQIEEIRTGLTVAETRSAELRRRLNMNPEEALDVAFVTESPGVQQVLAQLQTSQAQLVQQQALYTRDHPIIVNLEGEVAALKSLLQQRIAELLGRPEVPTFAPSDLHLGSVKQGLASELIQAEIDRTTLTSQMQTLATLRSTYVERAGNLPDLEKRQRELELALALAQGSYQKLLSRLPELVIAESQTIGNSQVKILEAASLIPIPPPGLNIKIIAAGVVGGGAIGFTLAFVLEIIDRSIKTIKDGEALLGYPLLGVIPEFKTAAEKGGDALVSDTVSPRLVVQRSPQSALCESYQMLQAQLRIKGMDAKRQILVIASAAHEEGRSEIAANLAAAMAQARRRVLLIDGDLRSPNQHLLWKLPNDLGFSDLLQGERNLKAALHRISPTLMVLTAGATPANPFALLDSNYTSKVLYGLAKRFDYIVIDTPPLEQGGDALVLGQIVNQVLFVMRPRFTDPNIVLQAKNLLSQTGINVLGFVANQIDFGQEHNAYAYYRRKHTETDAPKLLDLEPSLSALEQPDMVDMDMTDMDMVDMADMGIATIDLPNGESVDVPEIISV
jgi:capsular exopolysaccharide synthesis family protein